MRSLSEIETVSKRSSRAAGYSWGIAEEVAKNIRLLEIFNLPGVKNLNSFFKKKKKLSLDMISAVNQDNVANRDGYCPIIAGVNVLDQIKTLEKLNQVNFKKVLYPLLFLPFISRATAVIGKRIFLKIDDKEFLLNFNNNIYSNYTKNEIIESANNVNLKVIENRDSFNDDEWNELYKLSEETFVEENESLKQGGAGAGLTDND
ncbi:DUF3726 domain-containing protein [Candidatus Pelagibacter bacterium]|nr:DUF3726 domain-containing protein [Candidatus Pelagibacter bacterium]MDB9745107.1 DUF3726 domain-containing protein [Candidatus Pelagibacter sp.]MDC0618320.1 DUF3726 domain-containing protein [Candidatus Pelagibacter sp.]